MKRRRHTAPSSTLAPVPGLRRDVTLPEFVPADFLDGRDPETVQDVHEAARLYGREHAGAVGESAGAVASAVAWPLVCDAVREDLEARLRTDS